MGDGRRILQILLPPPSAELRIRRAVGTTVPDESYGFWADLLIDSHV